VIGEIEYSEGEPDGYVKVVNMDKEKNGKKLIKRVQDMNNLPTSPICYIGG
jgi:hypothetical protein